MHCDAHGDDVKASALLQTGLVSLVEDTVREEAKQHPGRPIYLLGDDFGGALALAVAARNTQLHLILILLNPCESHIVSSSHSMTKHGAPR